MDNVWENLSTDQIVTVSVIIVIRRLLIYVNYQEQTKVYKFLYRESLKINKDTQACTFQPPILPFPCPSTLPLHPTVPSIPPLLFLCNFHSTPLHFPCPTSICIPHQKRYLTLSTHCVDWLRLWTFSITFY